MIKVRLLDIEQEMNEGHRGPEMIKQLSQLLVSNESISNQKQAAYLAERITGLIIKCSQDDSFGTRVQ